MLANHFTIHRGDSVCAQWPHALPLIRMLTQPLTNPMLPYPPVTHWAALRRCDRCLIAKINVILALAGNDLRIHDTDMEASNFSHRYETTTVLCASTCARVRSR